MNNEKKNTLINLSSNIVSFVVNVAIGFFLSPYIVKHLGAEANGFTQLANNFVSYASLITIAINSMAGRFMSIEYHKGNIKEVKKYYSSLLAGNIIISSVLVVISVFILANIEKIINVGTADITDIKLLFGLVFATFFVSIMSSTFYTSAYVKNKLVYTNVIALMTHTIRAILLMLIFAFFEPKMYFVSLVGLIIALVTFVCSFGVQKKLLPEIKFERKNCSIKHISKLVKSGIWNTINQCGNLLMTGLDLLLANLFINPYEMGLLSVAKTIPNYIIELGTMVNNNFAPGLTKEYATGDKKTILNNLRWAMKISSVMLSIPIGVFVVFGSSFYQLWVPSLEPVKMTVLSFLTCMAFVPLSGTQVLYNVFTTTNKLRLNSVTVVLGGFVNAIVVYILLRFTDLGVYAVAGVSSLISLIRGLIITVPYAAKLLKLKWYTFYRDVGVSCICFMIVLMVSLGVLNVIPNNGWITLIISVGVSCIVSIVLELLILLSKAERRKMLNTLIKKGK